MNKSIQKNDLEYWEMPLLFRNKSPVVSNNRKQAVNRMEKLLRSFKQKPELKKRLSCLYEKDSRPRPRLRIPSSELATTNASGRVWYLPTSEFIIRKSLTNFELYLIPQLNIKARFLKQDVAVRARPDEQSSGCLDSFLAGRCGPDL